MATIKAAGGAGKQRKKEAPAKKKAATPKARAPRK